MIKLMSKEMNAILGVQIILIWTHLQKEVECPQKSLRLLSGHQLLMSEGIHES